MLPFSKQNCTSVLAVGPGEGRRAPEGFAIKFVDVYTQQSLLVGFVISRVDVVKRP